MRVVFLLLPRVELLDLAGPAQVFAEAAALGADYRLVYCASAPALRSQQGLQLGGLQPLPEPEPEDLIVVPGGPEARDGPLPAATRRWLQRAAQRGAQVCSVCTGAFALGEAGLLAGRDCTTHWSRTAELQRRFPAARVLESRLFVEDRGVISSAGIASGIDLSLWLVERRHGARLAGAVAREMVVYLRRDGAQSQSSIFVSHRDHLHPGVHRAQDLVLAAPARRHTLSALARAVGMSPRNFSRQFHRATGVTVHAFATRARLEQARPLLHDRSLSLEQVAEQSGFGDARQLRRAWREAFQRPPSQERSGEEGAGR
jgi:transcriptional regulator GlxA family with amidase domain